MNAQQQAALTRPVRDLARWEIQPLSRSTGGRVLAHRMGANSTAETYTLPKRRLVWRLPRSVLGYTVHDLAGVIGLGLIGLLVGWAAFGR